MKVIVQIPCLNEEETIEGVIADIPRSIDGVDKVEILIIDDGCTDQTVPVALKAGADHVLSFSANRGLGHAFSAGIDYSLMKGADIIVNTDGDNQYCGRDICKLVKPILDGNADIVIGDREPDKIPHFSPVKKALQRLGSGIVSKLSTIHVPDVASGFRAYSREAAMKLVCSTDFDHTVDHVIQAGHQRLATKSVPIETNAKARESRLFKNIWEFVFRSVGIMVRVYSSYRAFRIFSIIGALTCTVGVMIGLRFVYIYLFVPESSDKHVQSLILAAILILAGFQMVLTGIVADLINSNRSILENLSFRIRKMECEPEDKDSEGHQEDADLMYDTGDQS